MNTSLYAIILTIISTLIGAVGSLFLKISAGKLSLEIKKLVKNYKLILGIILFASSNIIFIIALKWGELSVLYPFSSLGYIFVSILSIKFLKEKMTPLKWIGVILITLGVALIGFS